MQLLYIAMQLNKSPKLIKRGRGRPAASSDGALRAVRKIKAALRDRGIAPSAFAITNGMVPSTVNRALDEASPRWTHALCKIYRIAINEDGSAMARTERAKNLVALSAALRKVQRQSHALKKKMDEAVESLELLKKNHGPAESG